LARLARLSVLLLILCFLFAGCEAEEFKTVVIRDDSPVSGPQDLSVQELEGDYVMLVLLEDFPDFKEEGLLNKLLAMPYSITQVENGAISARISTGLDYWQGEGAFFILFMIPDSRGLTISNGYISKDKHSISEPFTYISNRAFLPPIAIDIDLMTVL